MRVVGSGLPILLIPAMIAFVETRFATLQPSLAIVLKYRSQEIGKREPHDGNAGEKRFFDAFSEKRHKIHVSIVEDEVRNSEGVAIGEQVLRLCV
ncbi:hypothetical protein V22_29880 [Calycomorphotria hydatis]|uniref:Uncharacterized protein n=1 Tax=Calycomorphotria hydatis TaxID=2528027 RepID=A0A517TBH5_9PLAN|nr:hypothetical protein V22_29880 [Calycomorphotria hydatis]